MQELKTNFKESIHSKAKRSTHTGQVQVKQHLAKRGNTFSSIDSYSRRQKVADPVQTSNNNHNIKKSDTNSSNSKMVSDDYMRSIGYNPEHKVIQKALDHSLSTDPIITTARNGDQGVNGIYQVMTEGKNGESAFHFFKPITEEGHLAGDNNRFVRSSVPPKQATPTSKHHIGLNNALGQPYSIEQHNSIANTMASLTQSNSIESQTKLTNLHKNLKGAGIHREVASLALSKSLKMDDYLTNGTVREVEISDIMGNTKKHLGFLSQNIHTKFQKKDSKIIEGAALFSEDTKELTNLSGHTAPTGIKLSKTNGEQMYGVNELAKRDPRMGDKIMFDYLIGNTDRHGLNYFVQKSNNKNNKELSMKAFDNGLTFGNDNAKLHNNQGQGFDGSTRTMGAQTKMLHASKNTKVTQGFKDAFKQFIKDSPNSNSDYKQMMGFIKDKIGTTEAMEFKKRVENIANGLFKHNDNNLQDSFKRMTENPNKINVLDIK